MAPSRLLASVDPSLITLMGSAGSIFVDAGPKREMIVKSMVGNNCHAGQLRGLAQVLQHMCENRFAATSRRGLG